MDTVLDLSRPKSFKMKYALLPACVYLFMVSAAFSDDSLCRPEIKPASTTELAYKERGDRCEGLFAQKVSATGLRIAAFHKHPASYDDTTRALRISSSNLGLDKALSVTSLQPKQYYRMDTIYAGSNYSMNLDLVRHPDINISPTDFAAVICQKNCDTTVPTLIPASFIDDKAFNPYIALVANLELFELKISIRDGVTGELLFDKEILGSRTWPAGRPATFPLKPYLDGREGVIFDVVANGRGDKLIDSITARLQSE